ncbi:unnamed protein product [Arctogadus glacialis]
MYHIPPSFPAFLVFPSRNTRLVVNHQFGPFSKRLTIETHPDTSQSAHGETFNPGAQGTRRRGFKAPECRGVLEEVRLVGLDHTHSRSCPSTSELKQEFTVSLADLPHLILLEPSRRLKRRVN